MVQVFLSELVLVVIDAEKMKGYSVGSHENVCMSDSVNNEQQKLMVQYHLGVADGLRLLISSRKRSRSERDEVYEVEPNSSRKRSRNERDELYEVEPQEELVPTPPRFPPPAHLLNFGKAVECCDVGGGVGRAYARVGKLNSDDSKTFLWRAVEKQSTDEVRRLLKAGVDPDEPYRGLTPLMKAAEEGYLEIMQLLSDCGCDIDAENKKGRTALSFAAAPSMNRVEQPEAVNLLLRNAADSSRKDSNRMTAKDWAVREKRRSAIAVFREQDNLCRDTPTTNS